MAGGPVTVRAIFPAPAPLVAVCQKCKSLLAFEQDDVRYDYDHKKSYASIPCPVCVPFDGETEALTTIEVQGTEAIYGDLDEKHYIGTLDERKWR